uniref:Uncharacterized protein n=1 Tax=Mustela putorius furo TaxID=9669 RepID=M3YR83_MUSPF
MSPCRRRPSTSLGSGPGSPAAAAASSCSSTNLFSSNSSMSTRRKREDSVFRAMAGTRRPLSRLRSGSDLGSTQLGTGSGSGAGSGRPAPPPPPPRADATARPLPGYAGTGRAGGREGRGLGEWLEALENPRDNRPNSAESDPRLWGASFLRSEERALCPRADRASWTS